MFWGKHPLVSVRHGELGNFEQPIDMIRGARLRRLVTVAVALIRWVICRGSALSLTSRRHVPNGSRMVLNACRHPMWTCSTNVLELNVLEKSCWPLLTLVTIRLGCANRRKWLPV